MGCLIYRRASLEDKDGLPDINGESSFPSKLTKEELLAHYARDDFGFSAQMQCTPRPGRDRSFDTSWIRWGKVVGWEEERPRFEIRIEDFDPEIKGDSRVPGRPEKVVRLCMMNIVVMLDPAPTEQSDIRQDKGARNGVAVIGQDAYGRKFILETWAGREDPLDIINRLFSLCKKWGTNKVAIEEVNFSKLYRHWMIQESEKRKFFVHIMKLHPGKKDKDTRITGLIPGYKSGIYYHNQGKTLELVKEMAEYPYGATVDVLDIHAYDGKIGRPSSLEEEYEEAVRKRGNLGVSEVTGY
jgi:hypothetical protein